MKLSEALEQFDRAVEFYLKELTSKVNTEERSWKTLDNYSRSIRLFRGFYEERHAEDEDVSAPGFLDVQAWRDDMFERGRKRSTVEQHLKNVSCFFGYMSGDDLGECKAFDRNPVSRRIKPTHKDEDFGVILTDEQVVALWDNEPVRKAGMKVQNWPRNYAIVIMLLCTELRNMELADLRVSDLDFEYEEVNVRCGKGRKSRCVDFPKLAQSAVKLYLKSGLRPDWLTDDDYLFGSEAKRGFGVYEKEEGVWEKMSKGCISNIVERHVKTVTGVSNVRSHDLRHVGSRLDLHNGATAEKLQAKLGHTSFNTTQLYCGRLGTVRNIASAQRVYRERDIQAAKNELMLTGA